MNEHIEFQNAVDICSYFLNDWIYWLRLWNWRESWAKNSYMAAVMLLKHLLQQHKKGSSNSIAALLSAFLARIYKHKLLRSFHPFTVVLQHYLLQMSLAEGSFSGLPRPTEMPLVCAQAYRGGRQADWRRPLARPRRILGGLQHSAFPSWNGAIKSNRYLWTSWIDSRLRRVIPTQQCPLLYFHRYSQHNILSYVLYSRWRSSSMVWAAPFGWQGKLCPPFMWASCWAEIKNWLKLNSARTGCAEFRIGYCMSHS